jgi:hypothetical protein
MREGISRLVKGNSALQKQTASENFPTVNRGLSHRGLFLSILLLALLVSCVHPRGAATIPAKVTMGVDEVCAWTGMRRIGPIVSWERWRSDAGGYNVEADLRTEGAIRRYLFRFDKKRTILSYQPLHSDLSNLRTGPGLNSAANLQRRAACIAAVSKLNRNLHRTYYGKPTIWKDGRNFAVIYETVSRAEQERTGFAYLDAFVTFIVTPNGTVTAIFLGA